MPSLLDLSGFGDPQQAGLLALAAGLMSPGRYPGRAGLGEALSQGLMAGGTAYQQAAQAQQRAELQRAQLAMQQAQLADERTKMGWASADREKALAREQEMQKMLLATDPSGKLLMRYRMDPKGAAEHLFPKPIGVSDVSPKDYTPESFDAFIRGGRADPSVLRRRPEISAVNGVAVNLQDTAPGTVLPQDPSKMIIRGPDGKPQVNPLAARVENANNPFTFSLTGEPVPNKPVQDFAIRRATAGASNVTMGAPFVGVGPDGTPQLYQPGNRPGVAPTATGLRPPDEKLKPIPPAQMDAISGNRSAIANIDATIAAIQDRPASLGAQNFLPDWANQRIDPKGVTPRAMISGVKSQKYHDLSGAAVSASEDNRLSRYIPSDKDSPEVAIQKLRNLRQEYENTLKQQLGTYNREQGYKSAPEWKAPAREFQLDGGDTVIGRLNPADGKYYFKKGGKTYPILED